MAISFEANCYSLTLTPCPATHTCHAVEQQARRRGGRVFSRWLSPALAAPEFLSCRGQTSAASPSDRVCIVETTKLLGVHDRERERKRFIMPAALAGCLSSSMSLVQGRRAAILRRMMREEIRRPFVSSRCGGWRFGICCAASSPAAAAAAAAASASEIAPEIVAETPPAAIASSKRRSPSEKRVGAGSRLIGCGSAVPARVVSNDDLSLLVDTSDEWIRSRTGISRRRVLSGDETLTGLAVEACRKALDMANVNPSEVDLILLCTSTPEDMFGSACKVQAALGATNSLAFDITAACSGFVLGLVTATRFIRGGGYKNIIVVGADALSRYVDWTDRGTCILFGDGSGAVLVQASEDDNDSLLGFDLRSDGNGGRHLKLPILTERGVDGIDSGSGHASLLPSTSDLHCKSLEMNGRDVFRFAVRAVPDVVEAAMEEAGLTAGLIDWLLLHQANRRILDSVAETLHIPQERVISNLVDYGNTSAASIPLALDEAVRSGQIRPGHVVATAGFGAGLTWASAIIKWG